MWYSPAKYYKPIKDVNLEIKELKGELDDKTAKITLAKFLYRNLGLTTNLLTGIDLYPDQIIHLKALMRRNFSLCVFGRGCSKCELYDDNTKVIIKNKGLIPITKLFPNVVFDKERWDETQNPIEIWNGEKWVEMSKFLIQPGIPSKKVSTSNGYSLSGSERHLIQIWDSKSCKIIWKRYDEIKIGDYACISRENLTWGEKLTNYEEDYLIGSLLGDGHLGKRCSFTSADEESLKFIENFPCSKRYYRKGSRAINIYLKHYYAKNLLEKYQVPRTLSYFKKIPDLILNNKNRLKACLQALFDTDGHVRSDGLVVEFTSTSKEMVEQIHDALLTFGIVSKLGEEKTKSKFGKAWSVNICGINCKLFYEEIGFRLSRKQKILENHLINHKYNTNKDIIPGIKEFCHQLVAQTKFKGDISELWHKVKKRRQFNLSYNSLNEYIDFFKKININQEHINFLEDIKNKNLFFDKIERIEDLGNRNCLDFNIPDGQKYWSNGFISHNTFLAAVFCILQMIFEPNTNILIAGPTFRTARFIFNHIEKIANSSDAKLLLQAMGAKIRRPDEFRWMINGGDIVAIPLNGEKIRGFRANILVIDEFLLMSEEIVERVLTPYLVASKDLKSKKGIREREDELISKGLMKEDERTKFKSQAKLIAMSSASYTCEYLYRKFEEYVKEIYSADSQESGASYFVSQLAWDAIPEERMDKSIIELASGNESNSANFQREYCAQFIDGSDSYFSMPKMISSTVKDGDYPTLLTKGEKDKKYILAIDPNFSNSPTADDFAMCVLEVETNKMVGTVVHQYAEHGSDLKEHIKYFHYIVTHFNIEFIIIDNAGHQFIEAANESEWMRGSKLEYKFFDFEPAKESANYDDEIKKGRVGLNKSNSKIVCAHVFSTHSIRITNEWLQTCIDYKKIWFGSSIKANDGIFDENTKGFGSSPEEMAEITKIIDNQDVLIKQVKYQCASIEVKTSVTGNQSFDLPSIMKNDRSSMRMRRDSYTALVLAAWGMKCYYDMMNYQVEESPTTFTPFFIDNPPN